MLGMGTKSGREAHVVQWHVAVASQVGAHAGALPQAGARGFGEAVLGHDALLTLHPPRLHHPVHQ